MAMKYLNVDYFDEAVSSITVVQDLASRSEVPLHPAQCRYLASKLRMTRSSLKAKVLDLQGLQSNDVRRTALRQLYFALKRAEMLLRRCCCEVEPSWLESAVTLAQIREDIVDILLDVRWWMSMVEIAITSERREGSQELELVKRAEKDLEDLTSQLQLNDNDLDKAVAKDNEELLKRVREIQESHASKGDHEYLLATHVRTRLEKTDLSRSTADELNKRIDGPMIGSGNFGAVQEVEWLKRKCALKMLNCKCTKEASTLSSFQHPHIVQFLRYWELLFGTQPSESPPDSSVTSMSLSNGDPSDISSSEASSGKSYILMELLPTDLASHLATAAKKAASRARVGSRRSLGESPSISDAMPMSQDVAIDVMLQVAKAMCHLNKGNVAHRDLKPSNVLLRTVTVEEVPELAICGYVRVKLADFGLVNNTALSTAMKTLSKNMGTRMYGAPEVFTEDSGPPEKPRYPRLGDVWSFGIMFNEVLTGKPPFLLNGNNVLAQLQTRIRLGLRPELPVDCPAYLKFCITQCWELHPEDRPNFTDVRRLLRLAQARSLDIIHKDHNLFTFTTRNGVTKRLHEPHPGATDPKPPTSWWHILAGRFAQLFTKRRVEPIRRPSSRADASLEPPQDQPLGYIVNRVWPEDASLESSKVDVIFFEGNVGRRVFLSCKDTWVQRGKRDVWWPRDWLPNDFNDDLRVLLLEYSISDADVKGVVDQLQQVLVFSKRWNRGHTWNRPIVLVGHSLGCVVIEQLVVALQQRASLNDDSEPGRCAEAFLANLAGCFFYAPPFTGLESDKSLLQHVFGGLTYKDDLFDDLSLDSPAPQQLFHNFMQARRDRVKLMALVEGYHTQGKTVAPAAWMEEFKANGGIVKHLEDSNHSRTCKPKNKEHAAYEDLSKFIREILEGEMM